MTCSNPIDPTLLADYWMGSLPEVEESVVEEHLMACDDCDARLREMIALVEGIRALAQGGSLRMIVSDTFVNRAAERGLQVRQYAPPPGGAVACTVTARDDLLITRLAANLAAAERVDLSLCDARGVEQIRLRDIPFRPDAGGVICQESITFVKDLPDVTLIARLLSVGASGQAEVLGEYTFNHTRTIDATK